MFIESMLKFDYGSTIFDRVQIYALDSLFGWVKFPTAYFFVDDKNLF